MTNLHLYKGLENICKPLFAQLPIKAISYARFYPDGRRLCISNALNYVQRFILDKDYFRSVPNPSLPNGENSIVRIADTNALMLTTNASLRLFYEDILRDYNAFGLQSPYSILLQKPDYYEEFSFIPSANQVSPYERLAANYDTLRHFGFYFLEKAHDIIKKTPTQKYARSELPSSRTQLVSNLSIQAMRTKKYYFNSESDSYLTKREAHCSYLLTKDLSSQEIGDIMNISRRTAEEHIENIKRKINASNKKTLSVSLRHYNFDRLIEFAE